jgi:excinuclease ABC subunit A
MGLEGGDKGGYIIATGSPQSVAKNHPKTKSYTGEYLAKELGINSL